MRFFISLLGKSSIILPTILICAAFGAQAFGQSQSVDTQTSEQRLAQLEEQIKLLEKEKALADAQSALNNRRLNEIIDRLNKQQPIEQRDFTQFSTSSSKFPEGTALSYQALSELVPQITEALTPTLSRYSSLVVYREKDFIELPRYRLFRDEAVNALKNYDAAVARVRETLPLSEQQGGIRIQSVGGVDPLAAFLSAPSMATSFAYSAAGLVRVFRTEATYSETLETIDDAGLGAMLTNELIKSDGKMRIFYPEIFSPDYSLASENGESILGIIMRLNEAKSYTEELLVQWDKLTDAEKRQSKFAGPMAKISQVDRQLDGLLEIFGGGKRTKNSGELISGSIDIVKMLVRADKLDRFLRAGDPNNPIGAKGSGVGVIKFRVLNSGGSRKVTRNLFLGNKVTYSGMAVVEVMVFDLDGTLRESKVFSHHTGFQEMKTVDK